MPRNDLWIIGLYVVLAGLCVALPLSAAEAGINDILRHYNSNGAPAFDAARGQRLWNQKNIGDDGTQRDCSVCHGTDLTRPGKHRKSGKPIDPMAPSVNKDRYTDLDKIEKWLKRNCKWTFGRECTDQEKGDLLIYLSRL